MRNISLRAVDKLCAQLAATKRNAALVDKEVGAGVRQRVLDKDTLGLVLQRLATTHGDWQLALLVLQSKQLDQHGVRRDDTLWRIVDNSLPPDPACKAATHKVLARLFQKSTATTRKP